MYKKEWIASNIKALIQAGRADNVSTLAVRAGLTKPTLTTFMKEPELRNVNIDTIIAVAEVLRVEPWILFIPDFPVDTIGHGRPVKRITGEGYRLLNVFESLPDDKRKAILDFALFQIAEAAPVQAKQIREARAQYTVKPVTYKTCDEDFQ
ncbi:hypothetical protein [Thiothrix sp.]|jgi:lambda repressor-like predicted transcriptional regulator|uniref:hypothetical protein n=1 Tax=Thiothrix sp. TaxID=1032 RepID=UPI002580483D|nr:hypothetical protein [Thiothrix sp.]